MRMGRMIIVVAVWAMLLGSGAAHASLEPVKVKPQAPLAEVREAKLKVAQAVSDLRNGDNEKGDAELDALIATPGFSKLPSELRFTVLYVAAAEALQHGQYAKAHKLAVDATALDEATGETWLVRLSAAAYLSDSVDAGRSLRVIAERWPAQLDDTQPRYVALIHHALRAAHQTDVDRGMLEALFDADWQAGVHTYDSLWRDLALMQIESGEKEQAARTARRIGSADTALSMQVDKRFDPITQGRPGDFDVDRLLDAQIQAARARVHAHPKQLEAVQRLQDLLLEKGQYAEVLAVSAAAVAHAEQGDGGTAYSDFASHYNWVLNQRSLAFAYQGRWDDAVREMERAAKHPEDGGFNVSQSINLAGIYTDLDEPDKASAAIIEPGAMSPYGAMQLHYVRLQIAIEKNDAKAVAEHMAYLKKHRADDIATWQRALLRHGDLDAAARVLIERLQSPDWRNDALIGMQHYMHGAKTPTMKMLDDRWNTVTSRPDVLKALANVGRIERFNVTAPAY